MFVGLWSLWADCVYILPMKLKGTSLKWRLCLKMYLFLFPVHLRSKGTRPFRSVKHFFTNHNIILGSSSSSCRKGCCFFKWDFQQLGVSLTAVVMSCSQFLWESFTCLPWKRELVPHLPTLSLQTVVNFRYDVLSNVWSNTVRMSYLIS